MLLLQKYGKAKWWQSSSACPIYFAFMLCRPVLICCLFIKSLLIIRIPDGTSNISFQTLKKSKFLQSQNLKVLLSPSRNLGLKPFRSSGGRTFFNLVLTFSHFETWYRPIAFLARKIANISQYIKNFIKYGADQSVRRYMFSRA